MTFARQWCAHCIPRPCLKPFSANTPSSSQYACPAAAVATVFVGTWSFPGGFVQLKSTWTVRLGRVEHGISVTAGASAMPFSLGNHVSFKFPFVADGSAYTSGVLKGTVTQELNLTDGGLLNGATTARPEFADGLPLSAPTACNAVLGGVPDDKPAVLELVQPGVLGFRLEHGPVPDALKPYRVRHVSSLALTGERGC